MPLPCALLALSVVVCLGASGPVEASVLRAAVGGQAEQRHSLGHLFEAIQQAAKKLSDRLEGQAAYVRADTARLGVEKCEIVNAAAARSVRADHFLREALLNLPPPSC